MIDDLMDERPVDQGPESPTYSSQDFCAHTYFDGRPAVTNLKWSDKGFVGRCQVCGAIIEQ